MVVFRIIRKVRTNLDHDGKYPTIHHVSHSSWTLRKKDRNILMQLSPKGNKYSHLI